MSKAKSSGKKGAAKGGKRSVRIGVFVCQCDHTVSGAIDIKKLAHYATHLPNVVYSIHLTTPCNEKGLDVIKDAIKSHDLDRIVVAGCSTRTQAPLFGKIVKQAGLDRSVVELVNIREPCTMVNVKDKAVEKAKDLLRMGVAKASMTEATPDNFVKVEPRALVLGAGPSGLTAALTLAAQGLKVELVEKEKVLGGRMRQLNRIFPSDQDPKSIADAMAKEVQSNKNITVHLGACLEELTGHVGEFNAVLSNGKKVKVGTVIVATGANMMSPVGWYGSGKFKNVITQFELEFLIQKGKDLPKKVVMIQCVGSRADYEDEGKPYCSKICCLTAIKNAINLKRLDPSMDIHILNRDIYMPGTECEAAFHDSKGLGIRYNKFSLDSVPEVLGDEKATHVQMINDSDGKMLKIPVDLVVLSTPMVGRPGNVALSKALNVQLDKDGFFKEDHVKFHPLEFSRCGIYLCGTARAPMDTKEAISEGYGAAAKAAIPMATGKFFAEPTRAEVDPDKCSGCSTCIGVCPYGALSLIDLGNKKQAEVDVGICKGCGTCVPHCPSRAITQWGFSDAQMLPQIIEAARSPRKGDDPLIIGFYCSWCAEASIENAGEAHRNHPAGYRLIKVMCAGRMDPVWALTALLEGVDGVMVMGCHPKDCHYNTGNRFTAERVKQLKQTLKDFGLEPGRLKLEWVSASEGKRFAEVAAKFSHEVKALGPNPLRKNVK